MHQKGKKGLKDQNGFAWNVVSICGSCLILIIEIVLISFAFSSFSKDNISRVKESNEEYIRDFTVSLADKLDEKFKTYQVSIEAVASMMEEHLVLDESLSGRLASIEAETQFDHVRFVDENGISHTSIGTTADVSDRIYFIEGIKGKSGTTYVTDSRLTNQRQIGFYAPVVHDGNIRGVMVAFCDEETLQRSIDYSFYSEKASAGIITTSGEMIVNSPSDGLKRMYASGIPENPCDFVQTDLFSEEDREKFIYAYTNGTETAYDVSWNDNISGGYIAPLKSVELNVFMNYPAAVYQKMNQVGIDAGRKLQIRLIAIFSIAVIYILIVGMLRVRKERLKSTDYRDEANTDELTGLLNRRAYERALAEFGDDIVPDNTVYIEFDVNGLKNVNDTIGHAAGDELIIGSASCVKECFGEFGSIYRTGGDEFVAIITIDAEVLEEVMKAFDNFVGKWEGVKVHSLTISAGYARKSDVPSSKIMEMSLLADKRMYEAKSEFYKKNKIDRRHM